MSTIFIQDGHIQSFTTKNNRVGYIFTLVSHPVLDGKKSMTQEITHIGDQDGTINYIFRLAQQMASGRIESRFTSPAAFLGRMLRRLDNPTATTGDSVNIQLDNLPDRRGLVSAINDSNRDLFTDFFVAWGRYDLARKVASPGTDFGSSIEIDAREEFHFASSLFRLWDGKELGLRLLRSDLPKEPGPKGNPRDANQQTPVVELFQIPMSDGVEAGNRYVGRVDDQIFGAGTLQQLESNLIRIAGVMEIHNAGWYEPALEGFKAAADAPPQILDMDSNCTIYQALMKPWQKALWQSDIKLLFGDINQKMDFTLAEFDEALSKLPDEDRAPAQNRIMSVLCNPDLTQITPNVPSEQEQARPRDRG